MRTIAITFSAIAGNSQCLDVLSLELGIFHIDFQSMLNNSARTDFDGPRKTVSYVGRK